MIPAPGSLHDLVKGSVLPPPSKKKKKKKIILARYRKSLVFSSICPDIFSQIWSPQCGYLALFPLMLLGILVDRKCRLLKKNNVTIFYLAATVIEINVLDNLLALHIIELKKPHSDLFNERKNTWIPGGGGVFGGWLHVLLNNNNYKNIQNVLRFAGINARKGDLFGDSGSTTRNITGKLFKVHRPFLRILLSFLFQILILFWRDHYKIFSLDRPPWRFLFCMN